MINKYTNKQRGLLAVIMAMVMVFAGAAFVAAEVDAADTPVYVNADIDDADADGSESKPYKTLSEAIDTIETTGTIVLLSDVEFGTHKSPTSVGKSFILNGNDKKLVLKGNLSVSSSIEVTMNSVTIVSIKDAGPMEGSSTKDSQITNYGTLTLNACKFIGIDGEGNTYATEYGVHAYENSTVNIIGNTDFNGKKLMADYTDDAPVDKNITLNINSASNVYLNMDESTNYMVVDEVPSPKDNDLVYVKLGSLTAVDTISLRPGTVFDLGGESLAFDNIFVKTGNYSTIQNGTITGSFSVYEQSTDPNSMKLATINFGNDAALAGVNKFAAKMTLTGDVTLNKNASIALSKDAIISATVNSTDGSSAIFTGVKADTGGVTITQGSIVIGGAITTDSEKIEITSGTAKINVKEVPGNISFEVSAGATLIVPENIKMNSAVITVKGGTVMLYSNANVTYDSGKVAVAPGVVATKVGSIDFTPESTTPLEDNFGMKNTLEYDYVVQTKAFLADKLTIPEGVTLTVKGELDLCSKNLIVLGTLVVEKKGVIESGIITLGETGTIQNEGTIGYKTTVTVKDQKTLAATVEMKGVAGIGFSLTKEVTETGSSAVVTYTLTVSGEAVEKVDEATLSINGAYITDLVVKDVTVEMVDVTVLKNGAVSIDSKGIIEVDGAFILKTGVTLDVDGIIKNSDGSGDKVVMCNGTTVVINGSAQDVIIEANTGTTETYDNDGKKVIIDEIISTLPGDDIKSSSITLGNLNGITIEITSKSFTKEDSNGNDVSYIEQMMNVYGTAAFADKDRNNEGDESVGNPSGDITVVGNVYVPAGSELILGEDMDLVTSNSTDVVITVGLMKTLKDADNNYKGSKYVIEATTETGSPYPVFYYTNFDDAYAAIATADDMTIYIAGGYEFTKEYTIAADQTINLADDTDKEYIISKDGKITVEAEGTILPATDSFDDIKGLLIVMDGGSCKPASDAYEVSSKDADGNMTYTSAELAIANAQAGETIYITGTVTFEDETTIPEGVTVEISTGSTINAEKDLEIEGELINKGTVNVGTTDAPADLTVTGEVDTTEGIVNVKGEATVTGEVIGIMSATKINAASYIDEADTVYSSVASAVAASATMDIPAPVNVIGKVSESSDVVLAEGQKLIIDGEVVLKSVRLDVGSNLTVDGKLTADVIAATGVMDTTGALADSVVSVKEIEDVKFDVRKNDAKSTVTMYMEAPSAGTITVATGSVELTEAIEVVKDTLVLKISEGAELVVKKALSGNAKAFSNAGTLKVAEGTSITGLTVGGTIDVVEKKALIVSDVTVSGTLTTGKDASVTVADGKYMYIGSKPTTLGAAGTVNADVSFGTDAYIVVFEGSTFTNTDADVKMDSTAYTINDIAFATVYILENATVDIETPLDDIVLKLEDLKTDGITIEWKSGSSKAETVGQYDTVNADIGYAKVPITLSAAPGLIVYIDDIQYDAQNNEYTIGTHTITIYLEKGYEGTPVVKLNGVAVTDGKLVITTDMMDLEQNLLSVTGATVMQDQPVVIQPSDSEKDGMELTDILLIVLVVLIVIMAIIVALRMMRS